MNEFRNHPAGARRSKSSSSFRRRNKRRILVERLETRALLSANPITPSIPDRLDVPDHPSHEDSDYHKDSQGNVYHVLPEPVGPSQTNSDTGNLGATTSLDQTFQLHSNPGAAQTIYLDFDGHTTSGTIWNSSFNGGADIVTPAYGFTGDDSFADSELTRIQAIWRRVAEDFLPFDVNVTTEEPSTDRLIKSGSKDNEWGVRVVVGGSNSWFGGGGGVAYVGSFNWSSDSPAFVFENNLGNGNEKYTAEAISHEAGHTLGLNHDGRNSPSEEYFAGYGSGATGWAPIMGNSYYKSLTQWSRGEYNNASNTEDDLAIITTRNGFSYRADDHGDSLSGATSVAIGAEGISATGIIERNDDFDMFTFSTAAGALNLNIDPTAYGPNLDIAASLFDAAGSLIVASNPIGSIAANLAANLAAGQYFVQVTGVGQGDPTSGGYSDYGSLGSYTLSGSIVSVLANDDSFNAVEDGGTVRVDVLANDSADPGETLTINSVSQGSSGGSVSIVGGTAIDYRPADNFFGQETFTYAVTDGGTGNVGTATVTVNVAPVNDAPTASNDSFNVLTNSSNNSLNVLANDSIAPDAGESLTVTSVSSGSAGGSLSINGGQEIRYTPAPGFLGQESFTYTINDGTAGSNDIATVTVTVRDALPGIDFSSYEIRSYAGSQDAGGSAVVEDGGSTLHLTGNTWKQIAFDYEVTADTVLEFDFRSTAQGEVHTIGFDVDLGLSPEYGFQLYGTQSWGIRDFNDYAASAPEWKRYTIPVGQFYTGRFITLFFGNDHDVSNADGESVFSNVNIYEAGAVNQPPTAVGDSYSVNEDSGITNLDVLSNDETESGETLTIVSLGNTSAGGSVSILGGASVNYQPAANFFGTETFTYTINDGTPGSNATATVTINVAPQNDAPVANDDAFSVNEDSGVTNLAVLSNDTTEAGETLTIVSLNAVSAGGSVSIVGGSSIDYQPAVDFFGTETFTYTVNDGTPGSNATATVTISVASQNDAPVATDDTFEVNEGSGVTNLDVLNNDTTEAGETLTIVSLGATSAGGSVSISGGSSIDYQPAANFSGTETFTYTVNDGTPGSNATATVTVTVAPRLDNTQGINFADYSIGSYAGSQDAGGIAAVEDGGYTLHLTGNTWKQIRYSYQVTPDTILEFDFRSPSEGEIHTIGFDQDLGLSEQQGLTLYGTQAWGIRDFRDYRSSAPGWKHYQIPVGQYYTGAFDTLFFGNDHDVSGADGESFFANVRVYEEGSVSQGSSAIDDAFAVDEDGGPVNLDVLANDQAEPGSTLSVASVGQGSAGGSIQIVNQTLVSYEPAPNFFGRETFTYSISDGGVEPVGTATVTIDVRATNDAPIAQNDAFDVLQNSSGNLMDVLGNDTTAPDSGESLTISSVTNGSAGGSVTITSDQQLQYTPAAGFTGNETFSYTVNDGTPGSDATAVVTVQVLGNSPGIDFRQYDVGSYAGPSQDKGGNAEVADGGATLHLTGNTWKQIAFAYEVTPDTILEFDFRSTSIGDIHTIGLDTDSNLSQNYAFSVYGTQNWGNRDYRDYGDSAPDWKAYRIPIGQFYTGTFGTLFFGNDHDVSNPDAESYFSNVRIFESAAASASLQQSNDGSSSDDALIENPFDVVTRRPAFVRAIANAWPEAESWRISDSVQPFVSGDHSIDALHDRLDEFFAELGAMLPMRRPG
ncbi:tandem-95 repeat protein [Roseiconus nitratireducens]|uniref:Tandem-95 repeat protein n=1 Tax=Roseiconus nitratireducens TaxID=2605748 RepID=A0A5M6D6W6_9BACT|nr:Ig-like domain-containing protein [Roseiconus nitratireducens]KAA5543103.1 tandem-95 repeat protein [Roseiconus nitratireducens]